MTGNSLPEFCREERIEDILSAITHGIGLLMAGAFLGLLLWKSIVALSPRRITAFSIYGGCLLFTYLSSTLYHSVPQGKLKNFFRLLDHCSIFLCIAGGYTPVILVPFHGAYMITFISIIWAVAWIGILLKLISFFCGGLNKTEFVSLSLYLVMGWTALVMLPQLIRNLPWQCLTLIAAGGLVYSVGVIFYANDNWKLNHMIWHLFIMVASALQFAAIFIYLT